MEVLLLLVMGAVNILCFMIGAKVGQSVAKGEKVELPNINPMEIVKEHRAKQEAEYKQSQYEAILHNLDSYDGTSNGQKDVPRG